MARLRFKVLAESSGTRARAAVFQSLHGPVETPIFMPVGTQATVKSQTVDALLAAGSRVLLANTYHLLLRPGPEVFEKFGGIHSFMNWKGPVLTDSGGFQIFSLPHSRQMDEEGARFQSYVDGKMYLLSPEVSIRMQRAINSDIMMVLDQCVPSTVEKTIASGAMELTHRWARRSLDARGDSPQALFGIVQGACYRDLRKESARVLTDMPFDGYAIGGLAVGETKSEREDFCEYTASLLPRDLPRYLMGVGTPLDILEAVHRGVDMFDCILPAALAQRGVAFTSKGKLQMRRTVYKFSEESLDPSCDCATCTQYSRAYLHHLYKADEVLGWKLLASHNLTFYHRLMREIRENILAGRFVDFYHSRREDLARADDDNPVTPPRRSRSRQDKGSVLGDYEVHQSKTGFSSIRQRSSGEVMHSVTDPMLETELLYIRQSRLVGRLQEPRESKEPLVIWDVGLGAATNAMGALTLWEKLAAENPTVLRPLHLISFENDLDSLRLAAKHPSKFAHLRHAAPHALLQEGRWLSPNEGLRWELVAGDFIEKLETAPPPDLIYYDLFSSKSAAPHWTGPFFERLLRHCANKPAELYTYSASTAVRVALLSAGFYVGRGIPMGPKEETTIAFSHRQGARELLGPEWLGRWSRSHVQFPPGLSDVERAAFERRITGHPQFMS